ncbi:MAG: tetratricopeptide repeat protein [candidate division WOR-3 bacterium]
MAEQDFSEIAKLSERYSKDPKSRIFVQLADAYRKNNMVDEALEVLKQGLQYHPNYPLAYLILGKCHLDRREYNQAKDALQKTVELDPMNIVALRLLVQVCNSLKDDNCLISAYRGIVTVDPTDAVAKEKLAQLENQRKGPIYTITLAEEYERQGNLEEALRVYEHLGFTDPQDIVIQKKIKELKERLKKKDVREEEKVAELKLESYFQPEELAAKPEIPEIPTVAEPVVNITAPPISPEPPVPPTLEPEPQKPVEVPSEEIISMEEILLESAEEPTKGAVEETSAEEIPAETVIKEIPDEVSTLEIEKPIEVIPVEEKPVEPTAAAEGISPAPEGTEEEIAQLQDFLQPTEVKEETGEPKVETVQPPTEEQKVEPQELTEAPKTEEKKEEQKLKEEDFKSFQDWLSSLLK